MPFYINYSSDGSTNITLQKIGGDEYRPQAIRLYSQDEIDDIIDKRVMKRVKELTSEVDLKITQIKNQL